MFFLVMTLDFHSSERDPEQTELWLVDVRVNEISS